jgi:hypothetical protein
MSNAMAVVDPHLDPAVPELGLEADVPCLLAAGGLLGVDEQVQDHLSELGRGSVHARRRGGEAGLDLDRPVAVQRGHLKRLVRHGVQIHRLPCGTRLSRQPTRRVHDAGDAIRTALGLPDDLAHLAQLVGLGGLVGVEPLRDEPRQALEMGQVAAHEGQRIVDLVRDPGRQHAQALEPLGAVSQALRAMLIGAIVGDQEAAELLALGAGEVHPAHVQDAAVEGDERLGADPARDATHLPRQVEVRAKDADHVAQRVAAQGLHGSRQQCLGSGVRVYDPARGVGQYEGLAQMGDHLARGQGAGLEEAVAYDRRHQQHRADGEVCRSEPHGGRQRTRHSEGDADRRHRHGERDQTEPHALDGIGAVDRGAGTERDPGQTAQVPPAGVDPEEGPRPLGCGPNEHLERLAAGEQAVQIVRGRGRVDEHSRREECEEGGAGPIDHRRDARQPRTHEQPQRRSRHQAGHDDERAGPGQHRVGARAVDQHEARAPRHERGEQPEHHRAQRRVGPQHRHVDGQRGREGERDSRLEDGGLRHPPRIGPFGGPLDRRPPGSRSRSSRLQAAREDFRSARTRCWSPQENGRTDLARPASGHQPIRRRPAAG